MNNRKYINSIFILLILFSMQSMASKKSGSEPWKILFNGKDFKGWSIIGSFGKAWVEDSTIVTHMVSNTPEHTFVRTNKKYKDFILEADCKLEGNIHSGFILRSVEAPDTASVCIYGYQVKLDPNERRWSGGIFDDFGKTYSWWYTLADYNLYEVAYLLPNQLKSTVLHILLLLAGAKSIAASAGSELVVLGKILMRSKSGS